ncbi:uncharacterized protein [Lolium perenne]|uniref:uncharacterized protein isoform X1 n=1 Tax=Lolium perenne TaxID=4522 RepID=UPI0021F6773F|nr:uncharacterized protein LOC127301982 isoform X1 [Lolium perenne]
MENLFMQVFESRDAVAAQIRHQGESYAHSLARAFHLHGHRPPPWLIPSCAAAPQELNGKPIIPEFLFAGSQITTPATSRTVFLPRAAPSTSFTSAGVPNEYVGLETICDTLDANQHEAPQQKQVSADDRELAEATSEVNIFSVVKRSRSRQRHIEDRSREKGQGAKSGSSDVIPRSEHATAGSKRTAASLSSKPSGDGANNAGTRTSLLGLENGFRASEGISTESFKRSKHGDPGNQGVQLGFSQNRVASSGNNVKVPKNCPVGNLLEVQVTGGSVCQALPATHLSVEPKKLQFDGVESVCMNPASEQTMQQPYDCAPESANIDLDEAHSLNEVQVTCSAGHALPETYLSAEQKKLQFDVVESVCMNPASEQMMQQPKCALESASFDLAEAHSVSEVQVAGRVCHTLPETYLSVEPKKLQFDGFESVCMNPASEQTMQQPECALGSANSDRAKAHSLNEDPPSASCSQVSRFMGRLLLDGMESGYLNPDSAPVKQLQEGVLERSSLGTHPVKEDESPSSSSKVPNPTSVLLVERDTLHTVEDTGRTIELDDFSDRITTQSPESSEQHCADLPSSESLEPPTQLADNSSEAPAPSRISLDDLLEEDGCEDLSHSPINDEDRQCSQFRSAACPEKLQPQTVTLIDVYNTSLSPYKTQSNGTHSNRSPVVNASVSEENEVSQEQHFLARTSSELNEAEVGTPLGHASPASQNEILELKPAHYAVNCNSGKLGADQEKFSALTKACDISVSNTKDESAVPEVMSCISARRTSEMHTTERNSMTSAEYLRQDDDTPLLENAVKENTFSCTADSDKRKSSQPYIQYFSHTVASHEKINLAKSDKSSASYDQKRSVHDGVQVNGGLSSKRRRIRSRSDFELSRTPCANSLALDHQVGISGDMLTTRNFSEKSQLSGRYFLRSSGSCKSMSLDSEVENAASNCKNSVTSDVYGNCNSSRGRCNTTSLLNAVLDNSPSASTSRSTMEGMLFDSSREQTQDNSEVEFLTRTASLPCSAGILSHNEENYTEQEDTCLHGQDLNVTNESVADQEMVLQVDNLSSPIAISNPENCSGAELFPVLSSYTLDQHGEQASAPNALFHEKLCYGSNVKLCRKYKSYDPKGHLLSGTAISRQLDDESFECDGSMPEFERFDVPVEFDSPPTGKRPFEDLYDSNAASGVWETLSGKPRNYSFSDELQQYSGSDSRSIMDSFGCGLELDTFFISDAVASCSSDANSRQEINETPLTPSVEKYSLRKFPSRSGSGSEHMGSIPELECFRIDEDNIITEEDEHQDMLPGSVDVNCSFQQQSGRKALQDITGLCQNNGNSPSLSARCMDTGNIDLSGESFSSELKNHSNMRKDHGNMKPKDSHPTSVKREGKVTRSLHGRLGTAEKRNSRNLRHRSEANVDRQLKPSNIVANMTSFIPLVKQKSQPTTACVKKDVKVKALKAAEAAKRLEEKKQKEQEIRKAAAKVERERLKREKEQKQKLEEEKKKRDEEEQKKKREVDAATKKRQREEGEKRETMKKRKCIDEARKQQKQPMDRRRGTKDEKDTRQKASDAMETKKNLVDVGKNQAKLEETTEPALPYKDNKSKDEKGVAVDERPASFGSDAKETMPNSFEESYDMSPFKDSDDEEDDDFEDEQESRRRMKFVPTWARKENLDKILLSNITLDPREIFARKSSFNISDVFSAYIPQRGLR